MKSRQLVQGVFVVSFSLGAYLFLSSLRAPVRIAAAIAAGTLSALLLHYILGGFDKQSAQTEKWK